LKGRIRYFLAAFAAALGLCMIVYGGMVIALHFWVWWSAEPQPSGKAWLDGVSMIEEDAAS